ncbi:Erp family outer-surface lipoprotein, partial [Borreliella afzelii]
MNKKIKMFIIFCAVFVLISSCGKFTGRLSEQGGLGEQVSSDTIKFSEFTVKIKNKDTNSGWSDLGTLVIRKEGDGIATGLNNDDKGGGHTATFFLLEESEVNNFVKAMTEGGSFKTSLYYGYNDEQSAANGIKNKEIKTKMEKINEVEHITFLGDKTNNGAGDKTAEYAIPQE